VDAFLVVLITLPVPIFISTYYVPPKSGSTYSSLLHFSGISTYYGSTYYVPPYRKLEYFSTVTVACFFHYCLTDLTEPWSVDSNDITVLVSGEQKHYCHLWGLQKPLVVFATRENNVFYSPFTAQ
jgi:hypothetical protein